MFSLNKTGTESKTVKKWDGLSKLELGNPIIMVYFRIYSGYIEDVLADLWPQCLLCCCPKEVSYIISEVQQVNKVKMTHQAVITSVVSCSSSSRILICSQAGRRDGQINRHVLTVSVFLNHSSEKVTVNHVREPTLSAICIRYTCDSIGCEPVNWVCPHVWESRGWGVLTVASGERGKEGGRGCCDIHTNTRGGSEASGGMMQGDSAIQQ